jgi:hypothetical protein
VATAAGGLRAIAPVAVLIATLLGAALLYASHLHPYLGDYGDDAEFLILGQSLATGQGYAWINSPEHPAHNRYPPGYPLLLALVMKVTGTTGDAFAAITPAKVATLGTALAGALVLWPLARRRLSPLAAAGAVALFAFNPVVVRYATQVMSDVPYVLVQLVALAWADRLLDGASRSRTPFLLAGGEASAVLPPDQAPHGAKAGRHRVWRWLALGALAAAMSYTRAVGMAASVGVLAWAWWRLGRRAALVAGGTYLLLTLPWWLRTATLAGGWRYLEELLAAQYHDPSAGAAAPTDFLARAGANTWFQVDRILDFGPYAALAGLVGAVAVAAGFWRCLRRPGGAAEWCVLPVLVPVLVWPVPNGRHFLPVVPLIGIYALAGALWTGRLLARRAAGVAGGPQEAQRRAPTTPRWWPHAVAAGALLAVGAEVAFNLRVTAANQHALAAGGGPAGYYRERPEWSRFLEAAAWLRQHAAPDDVVMARRHFAVYVYTARFSDKYRFDVTPEELAYLTAGTARKFVLEDAFDELRGDFSQLPPALRARGGDLVLRYETAPPAVRVWELRRPPATSDG